MYSVRPYCLGHTEAVSGPHVAHGPLFTVGQTWGFMHFHLFPTKVYNQWIYLRIILIRKKKKKARSDYIKVVSPSFEDILVKKMFFFLVWQLCFYIICWIWFFFFLPVRLWWHKVKVSVSSDLRTFSDTAETEGNRTIIMEWILPLENLSLTE